MKTMNNLAGVLAGTALMIGLNGCLVYNVQHAIKLKKYEPLSKEQKDSLLSELNPGLKEYLRKVYVIDEKDLGKNAYAHTHNNKKRTICFSEDPENRTKGHFHEAAHVREIYLNKHKSDFLKKWKKNADFKYGKKNIKNVWYSWPFKLEDIAWKDGTDGPKNGLLNPYSATSIGEDIAEFVVCLSYDKNPEGISKKLERDDEMERDNFAKGILKYTAIMDTSLSRKNSLLSKPLLSDFDSLMLESYSTQIDLCSLVVKFSSSRLGSKSLLNKLYLENYSNSYPLYFADTTDSRYKQKLDLLKEYNFLSNEEHKTLTERLGSLYYLKEKYLETPKEK